ALDDDVSAEHRCVVSRRDGGRSRLRAFGCGTCFAHKIQGHLYTSKCPIINGNCQGAPAGVVDPFSRLASAAIISTTDISLTRLVPRTGRNSVYDYGNGS